MELCLCACPRAAPLQDQPLQSSCLATGNGEKITWVPTGLCLCHRACAIVPGPRCGLSKRNHLPCPAVPSLPAFPLSPGRPKGREVQAQELILPTAERPLGHLKAGSSSSGALAGVLGVSPHCHQGVWPSVLPALCVCGKRGRVEGTGRCKWGS